MENFIYKDYYQTMGVERTASADEIKKAWRKQAHLYHPDASKSSKTEEKFKEIAEAYDVLKDPEKRKAYDELGKRKSGDSFPPPPSWQQHFNMDSSGFDDVDLADIFSAFGQRENTGRNHEHFSSRGQDFEVVARITLEQIFAGKEIDVHVELPEYDKNGLAHRIPRTLHVVLPKNAVDGQRLRLKGKGGAGVNGGKAGDLYIILDLQVHPLYRISKRDLYIDLPLTSWESVLGSKVQVPTLAGPVMLSIKPGTVNGQKYRLSKRGLPTKNGGMGALYAVVKIEVPASVSEQEKSLYKELGDISTFNPRQYF